MDIEKFKTAVEKICNEFNIKIDSIKAKEEKE